MGKKWKYMPAIYDVSIYPGWIRSILPFWKILAFRLHRRRPQQNRLHPGRLWTRHYLRVERRTAEDDVAGGHREQRGWQLDVYQKEVIIEYSDSMYILSYLIDPLLLGHSLVWCSSLSLVPTENLIRRLADCRSQSHFHSRSLVWWICQLCGNVDPESFSQAIWSRLASIDIAFGWTLARPKAGLQTNTDDVQT